MRTRSVDRIWPRRRADRRLQIAGYRLQTLVNQGTGTWQLRGSSAAQQTREEATQGVGRNDQEEECGVCVGMRG